MPPIFFYFFLEPLLTKKISSKFAEHYAEHFETKSPEALETQALTDFNNY